MGDNSGDEYVSVGAVPPPRVDNFKKVSLLPFVFLRGFWGTVWG